MNEPLLTLLCALILFESFEVMWQQGHSTRRYIATLLQVYSRSVFLFIALHPSFYFVIFCMMYFNVYTSLAWLIVGIKGIDIIVKLVFLDRLATHKHLGVYAPLVSVDQGFPWMMKLLPLLLYSALFYLAFA
ncbi:MAG: hypothetical protein IBX45_06405 [Campylobacterales bacterium]|nr:hypothetical protein [Campylobacterales bacterium]